MLVSYQIACTQYDDAAQGKVVGGLMQYIVSPEGQEAAAKAAGSAPISDKLRAQLQPAVDGRRRWRTVDRSAHTRPGTTVPGRAAPTS